MFSSPAEVADELAKVRYLTDEATATTVYVAAQLEKPLLVEGPAGVGKTQLAKAVAEATGADLIRLQCYEGLDEARALYEWNYKKQLLRIQAAPADQAWEQTHDDIFTDEFLLTRPLLTAIRRDRPTVLLVDEADKTDVEVEALLLEVLSDYQVTIPELGTITATRRPFVVVTSNATRELSEALKRRCLYLHLDYPTPEREREIVLAQVPEIEHDLADQLVRTAATLRALELKKAPSVAETIDWARTLLALGIDTLDEAAVARTLGVVLKHHSDHARAAKELGLPDAAGVSLLDRHVEFVAALREHGMTVSVAEGLDAVESMRTVDLVEREQLRAALAATLVKRQVHRPTFDTVFDVFYPPVTGASAAAPTDTEAPVRDPDAAHRGPLEDPTRDRLREALAQYLRDGDERVLDAVARDAVAAFGTVPGRSPGRVSWSRMSVLDRISAQTLMAGILEQVLAGQDRGGLAERRARTTINDRIARFERRVDVDVRRRLAELGDAESVARTAVRPTIERVNFMGATRTDLVAMRREIQPLARRLAARLAMDQRRHRRGQLDFRRTIRASLSSGGVPLTTLHRPRRPLKTDLVVLCDVSESVTSFAHFTLLLVYALREQYSRVRAFAFVDELDEVTRFFAPGGDVIDAVTRLASEADVTWILGRTDYGRAFDLFAHRFPDAIGPRTSLLILGDARSNYGELALPTLTDLAGRAKHAYWLNPERESIWDTGDSRASDFAAVVPMLECRNLAQLAAFVRKLG